MGKKRRNRRDSDVVRTEPDYRRATGEDDDDDFDEPVKEVTSNAPTRTTISSTRYRRAKSRKFSNKDELAFPFLLLPAEIRNMIYRYLVVSKSPEPIRLSEVSVFRPGGIETAILRVSKLIHEESAKIMYDENECVAVAGIWEEGIKLRVDDPKTTSATARNLRSGRDVDMVNHRGLIYEHVAIRLRKLEFQVNLFDRSHMCEHMAMYYATKVCFGLQGVNSVLLQRFLQTSKTQDELKVHGKEWKVVIESKGTTSLLALAMALRPLLQQEVVRLMQEKRLEMKLKGKFPKFWREVFRRFLRNVEEINAEEVQEDGEILDEDLDFLDDIYFDGLPGWDSEYDSDNY